MEIRRMGEMRLRGKRNKTGKRVGEDYPMYASEI